MSKTITVPSQGELGQGLGQVVTITGTMLADDARGHKADLGKSLMRIETVAGKALTEPVVMALKVSELSSAKLPGVGTKASLIGYESGAFEGIPEAAFKHLDRVATEDFHFASAFIVIK